MTAEERGRRVEAYHDGELSRWGRRRVRRMLERDGAARRELEALGTLGSLLREIESETPTPDLWEAVEMRLGAVDARRREEEAAPGRAPRWIGASVAAAAAVLALVVAVQLASPSSGAVRWIDSNGSPVFVLQDDRDATIVWLLDPSQETVSRGSSRAVI